MDYENQPLYAIRDVADITGVKPVTLRAWQRRYGLIQPQRTEKGHRLFTTQDIERIKQIQSWLAKGVSIGKVALLIKSEVPENSCDEPLDRELDECAAVRLALADLNHAKCSSIVSAVMKEYPLSIVEHRFLQPILDSLQRVKMPLKSLQLGLFQSLLLAKFSTVLQAENKASRKGKILCVSLDPMGSLYAWLWACGKAEQGYHVTFLDGVDEVSGLIEHKGLRHFNKLELFANKALTESQLICVRKLKQQGVTFAFSGVIEKLHQQELIG